MRKFLIVFMVMVLISPVFAQAKYAIKSMTPEVQSALNNRRDRFDQIREFKSKGEIGENNKGYVESLGSSGQAQGLVSAENQDRQLIYRTIAEQNGLEGQLSTIEKVFASVQRDKAEAGDKIQNDSGQWETK